MIMSTIEPIKYETLYLNPVRDRQRHDTIDDAIDAYNEMQGMSAVLLDWVSGRKVWRTGDTVSINGVSVTNQLVHREDVIPSEWYEWRHDVDTSQ
jgi:hypothetical protein